MATIATLLAEGRLVEVGVPLDVDGLKWRSLYGTPQFVVQLQAILEAAEPSPIGSDLALDEQVDAILDAYLTGEPLSFDRQLKVLHPQQDGVWEFKTDDLRMFGRFPERDHFIATSIHPADLCKGTGKWERYNKMYPAFINEVRTVRAAMTIERPAITSTSINDVISVQY